MMPQSPNFAATSFASLPSFDHISNRSAISNKGETVRGSVGNAIREANIENRASI